MISIDNLALLDQRRSGDNLWLRLSLGQESFDGEPNEEEEKKNADESPNPKTKWRENKKEKKGEREINRAAKITASANHSFFQWKMASFA